MQTVGAESGAVAVLQFDQDGARVRERKASNCNMMCDPCFMDANHVGLVHELTLIDSKTFLAMESGIQGAMAAVADAGYELGTLLQHSSSKPTAPGKSSKISAAARKKSVKKCPESISGHTRLSGSSQQEDIQD